MDKWLRAVDALKIDVQQFNILDSRGYTYGYLWVAPKKDGTI